MHKPKILIAPLNWGLGHASRCIPIIREMLKRNYELVLASDGDALQLLQDEFPSLKSYQLAPLEITYSQKKLLFQARLIQQLNNLNQHRKKDYQATQDIIEKEKISGIVSDNRLGVYSHQIPSVYITHQLAIKGGLGGKIATRIHQKLMGEFQEIWVPDSEQKSTLSGELGHLKNHNLPVKYIGPLSRFRKKNTLIKYNYVAVLSGPEPQREFLQQLLLEQLTKLPGKKALVCGKNISTKQLVRKDIEVFGRLKSDDLEELVLSSEIIIARSGYSSIMDLVALGKPGILIPTPGQPEQEYLAKFMEKKNLFCRIEQSRINQNRLQKATKQVEELRDIRFRMNDFGVALRLFEGE
ncbi:MAG: glycosyltransferase [Bacteroidota bacterium]